MSRHHSITQSYLREYAIIAKSESLPIGEVLPQRSNYPVNLLEPPSVVADPSFSPGECEVSDNFELGGRHEFAGLRQMLSSLERLEDESLTFLPCVDDIDEIDQVLTDSFQSCNINPPDTDISFPDQINYGDNPEPNINIRALRLEFADAFSMNFS
jgi:hypothetical protein